jgi:hypothetical protein
MVSPSALTVFRLMTNSNLVRLPNRRLGGIHALEDAAGTDAELMKLVCEISSIAHQPAGHDIFTQPINRRNPVARLCQRMLPLWCSKKEFMTASHLPSCNWDPGGYLRPSNMAPR